MDDGKPKDKAKKGDRRREALTQESCKQEEIVAEIHRLQNELRAREDRLAKMGIPTQESQDPPSFPHKTKRALTREKHIRQHVEESRHRLAAAIEGVAEGVLIVDRQAVTVYVNCSFKTHWGIQADADDIQGRPLGDVSDTPETQLLAQGFRTVLKTNKHWKKRITRAPHGSGDSQTFDVTISPVTDDGSPEINGCVVVVRDVTKETKLERQLQQAQKMQALGTLAGGIAHDFNNVLMPIIINNELLLWESEPGSEDQRLLEKSLKAANRGKELIKQIVTYSRREVTEKEPIDVVPTVKEALKLLSASLPSNIEIRIDIQADVGLVRSDPTQLHQVLMNLCSNAAAAMSTDGGVLEVRVEGADVESTGPHGVNGLEAGRYLHLMVGDEGPGVKEIADRIFDPFFTTKPRGEGTGMGLAVVEGIVKSHGGHIHVESPKQGGARFHVYLPTAPRKEAPKQKRGPKSLPHGDERILLVDDEEEVVFSAGAILKKLGYTVESSTSSTEALEKLRAAPHRYDLLLTDQTMPNLTGAELAQEALSLRPNFPVILCTGFTWAVSADDVEAMGIREFVMKPLTPKKIAETIRRVLDKKASADNHEGKCN